MKWLLILLAALNLSACAGLSDDTSEATPATAAAQVGIVNHTGNYIYSASVDGAGGENMNAWGLELPVFVAHRSRESGARA